MDPSNNISGQHRPRSLIVTRVVPSIIALQILLTLVIYPFLPNIVPSHWNAAGQIDSYEPKWVFFGFLPLFSLILYAMLGAFFIFSRQSSNSEDLHGQPMEVSPAQAAALLRKSEGTIQQYIEEGKLSVHHLADGRDVVNLDELMTLRTDQARNESAQMILKGVMLMQQGLFLIIQTVLLLIALHSGSGAAH